MPGPDETQPWPITARTQTVAGRYTLVREIGRGGMGSVWLATDRILGRTVAVKRVGLLPGGSGPDLQRAEREARLAATLNHPHVVAVFDLVPEGHQQWLVMEYVEGMTLASLIATEGALSPARVGPLLVQAADALAAAHAAGIVHRDVKPSNILITPVGQVKLTDFGIARAEADATLTATGMVTGSPAYLAPEVASGATATPESDVWSMGATLFHALAGRPPYATSENVLGTLFKIVHEEPPRLLQAGRFAAVLEATMAKDPGARWSMRQVRDFLAQEQGTGRKQGTTRTAEQTAVLAVSTPPPTQTRPAPADPAPAQAAPAQTDPAQTDPAQTDPAQAGAAPPPPRPAAREPRRGRRVLLVVAACLLVIALAAGAWWQLGDGDGEAPHAAPPSDTASQETTEPSTAEGPTAAGMEAFVTDYLATATTDPRASWTMLTPDFQRESRGFASYSRFWRQIDQATPRQIVADPDTLQVSYTVDYVDRRGTRSSDQVTLTLSYADGEYLVADELDA